MKYLIIALVLLIPTAILAEEAQQSMSINDIRVLKISPQDQRAVIKTWDRELKIITVGDVIGNGKVTEITADRVVLEEETERGTETIIIRLDDGNQQVQRIKKIPDKEPLLQVPLTIDKNESGEQGEGNRGSSIN